MIDLKVLHLLALSVLITTVCLYGIRQLRPLRFKNLTKLIHSLSFLQGLLTISCFGVQYLDPNSLISSLAPFASVAFLVHIVMWQYFKSTALIPIITILFSITLLDDIFGPIASNSSWLKFMYPLSENHGSMDVEHTEPFLALLHRMTAFLGGFASLIATSVAFLYLAMHHYLKNRCYVDLARPLPSLHTLHQSHILSIYLAIICLGLALVSGILTHSTRLLSTNAMLFKLSLSIGILIWYCGIVILLKRRWASKDSARLTILGFFVVSTVYICSSIM